MITLDEILQIHKETIEMDRLNAPDDYAPGIRNIGTLYFMLEYCFNPTKSVCYNAAVAICIIAKRHPFINGNKRTASATALMLLKNEGINLTFNEKEKTDFIIDVATPEKNITLKMIEIWIRKNIERSFKMTNT